MKLRIDPKQLSLYCTKLDTKIKTEITKIADRTSDEVIRRVTASATEDDESSTNSFDDWNKSTPTLDYEDAYVRKFFNHLQYNPLFFTASDDKYKEKKWFICPCCPQMKKWREKFNLTSLTDQDQCTVKGCFKTRKGLITHLEYVGGINPRKDTKAFFHHGLVLYLKELCNLPYSITSNVRDIDDDNDNSSTQYEISRKADPTLNIEPQGSSPTLVPLSENAWSQPTLTEKKHRSSSTWTIPNRVDDFLPIQYEILRTPRQTETNEHQQSTPNHMSLSDTTRTDKESETVTIDDEEKEGNNKNEFNDWNNDDPDLFSDDTVSDDEDDTISDEEDYIMLEVNQVAYALLEDSWKIVYKVTITDIFNGEYTIRQDNGIVYQSIEKWRLFKSRELAVSYLQNHCKDKFQRDELSINDFWPGDKVLLNEDDNYIPATFENYDESQANCWCTVETRNCQGKLSTQYSKFVKSTNVKSTNESSQIDDYDIDDENNAEVTSSTTVHCTQDDTEKESSKGNGDQENEAEVTSSTTVHCTQDDTEKESSKGNGDQENEAEVTSSTTVHCTQDDADKESSKGNGGDEKEAIVVSQELNTENDFATIIMPPDTELEIEQSWSADTTNSCDGRFELDKDY